MRIPDSYLRNGFLTNFNKSKVSLAEIQLQLTTGRRVNKPSDDPLSNSRIMRLQNQLSSIGTYKDNISYGKSIIDSSGIAMEGMRNEILNVQVQLTELNSAIVNDNFASFATAIDSSLEILIDLANSDFNGSYNFAGTDINKRPFNYDKANNIVTTNSKHLGGEKVAKISSSITQKFNITGKELFQPVFSQTGNLDSTAGVGVDQINSGKIYDADGNEYDLNINYKQTAANTYDMTYEIVDSDSNVVETKTVNDLKFSSETGEFESMDGEAFSEIHVQNSGNKIDFVIDLGSMSEKDSTTKIGNSLSQNADIFNTLISIREKLLAGERPTSDQMQVVDDFYKHILNNQSKAGGITNKLDSTNAVLEARKLEALELLSSEKDIDAASKLIELQSAQYTLDLSYKISSMILPKSLLDYM